MTLENKKYTLDTGEQIYLSNLIGSRGLVLFFYPKAFTPGCSREIAEYSKRKDEFISLQYNIVGVSADTVEDQNKFACDLAVDVPLIADVEKDLVNQFNLWGEQTNTKGEKFIGIKRSTFIINSQLEVTDEFDGVDPVGHIQEVLDRIESKINN
ncbi:peroxiredoxin [Spiroplasma helicoides]|uniref:thioredoxin-dependent peroxiredoxin n=1 Tax=Spiroplasma helicoides TaxID=216938 RepID=A0A1B3SM58_9MOLU|nr:peroxiredoxin [Spiroplasma helicoides]AOG61021.1 peroxiredoxin [Spiroplasma helicoides]